MSIDGTMAVLYAQSGLSANLVNAQAVAPQAAAAMSRVLAMEQARHEREQVEKSEKAESARLNADGRRGSSSRSFASRRQARKAESASKSESETPFVGYLLNLKV